MEQYYLILETDLEDVKINTIIMYMIGDAKLW